MAPRLYIACDFGIRQKVLEMKGTEHKSYSDCLEEEMATVKLTRVEVLNHFRHYVLVAMVAFPSIWDPT